MDYLLTDAQKVVSPARRAWLSPDLRVADLAVRSGAAQRDAVARDGR
jgi:hypothetical protein